jgi:hypothetical protein
MLGIHEVLTGNKPDSEIENPSFLKMPEERHHNIETGKVIVFENDEELDDYSRKLLGVDHETYRLLLAEAEAELMAESEL